MGTTAAVRRRGRPARVEGQAATARVWVYLTPEERADLGTVARDNGYGDLGAFLRDVINAAVADYRDRPVFRGRVPHGARVVSDDGSVSGECVAFPGRGHGAR